MLLIAYQILLALLCFVALAWTAYLGVLALLAWRPRPPSYGEPTLRFAVVVPAHNEAAQIAATVKSLLATDYPPPLRRVVVVADNCSDDTAAVARAAGAEVIERHDTERRGKGYALELAFHRLLSEPNADGSPPPDACVVVDADSQVSKNLLKAMAHRLSQGETVMQARYGVSNPLASWRTRLMAVAFGMFHDTRSLGRERLRLSAGLRGNGMCFSRALLLANPHRAHGLVEDVEYGIALGLAGHRVAYVHEADVLGEMVSRGQAAETQRQRWEQGRLKLVRDVLPGLLAAAVRRHSVVLADLAFDLLVPPLSTIVLLVSAGVALELGLFLCTGALTPWWPAWLVCGCGLLLYGLRGLQHCRLGLAGVTALLFAPAYIVWKVLFARRIGRRGPSSWIRTGRQSEQAKRD